MLEIQNSDEQAERLRTLIEGLPDAIFFKDGEGRWRIVNSAGLRLFSLNDSAWVGRTDQELGEFHPEFADYFDACQQHDEQAWAKGSRYDTLEWVPDPASGEAQTFEVTKIPLFHADGSRRGLVTVGRNVTARQKAEAAATRLQESLRRLGQIAALSHLPMAAQFKQALALGAAHFDLEIGIVSRIEGNTYRIAAQVSPPGALEDGQEFPFGETYCSITCREQRVVAIHHMGISPYLGHPCYQAFRLETYIGAPVLVEGEVVGTINFSSPRVYDREFDAGDREFMALLAGWVSSAIEREAIQQRLREREEELRAIIENEPQCVKLLGPRGQLLQMNRAGLAMLEVDSFEEARDAGLINFVRPAYRESFSTLNRQVFGG
ncbi:MAG: PAS domain-containing protein, partial [Betaproteobacteria bacterium]|nr:PAS domain-containing protein [Betaproteobacteria bacterium]